MDSLEELNEAPHRGEPLGSSPLVRAVDLRKRLGAGSETLVNGLSLTGIASACERGIVVRQARRRSPALWPLTVFIAGKITCLNMAINPDVAAVL
jgi:hypothetical protein